MTVKIETTAWKVSPGQLDGTDNMCVGVFTNTTTGDRQDTKEAIAYGVAQVLDDARRHYGLDLRQVQVRIRFV